ncbi:MAG: beta(1,3)galactosyltransferase EpsH [Clostridia bacterium]|nr:beta(1,3)galactosyltransferase EpsH [Clostridia bacterium]
MIFITVGSQKFQFNRLLKAVDELVVSGTVKDTVFAQTGYSDYEPQHYEYKQFLNRDEFAEMEGKADIIITHGGTGAIIGAVKKGKKVVAVPRLTKYGEHVDDHQLQLIEQFTRSNLISSCENLDELGDVLEEVKTKEFDSYQSNTEKYLESIDNYICRFK